tara:strand:- start:57 stop:632 length:576 start_codon:yes stop_codon:yes gene_type:complete
MTKLAGFINIYLIKEKHPKFKLLQNKILYLPLVTYTNSSIFLLIFWTLYKIYYKNTSPYFTSLVWCILSNVTVGYWLLIKNTDNNVPKYSILMNNISNFMHHGGLLLLFSPSILYNPFPISSIYLPISFSLGWLLFIILPWYYYTGDSVYSFLDKDIPLFIKINLFIIMLFINIFTGILGSLISNRFKIIY